MSEQKKIYGVLANIIPCLNYTFPTRLKRFVSNIEVNDMMGQEELDHIKNVADQLLAFQQENATEEWEIDYLKRCHIK